MQSSVEHTEGPEREIKVWIRSLGNYPTDPANFRNIQINAEVRAEIVRYGPSKSENVINTTFKDTNDRSFQQSWYTKNHVPRDWLVYSIKEDAMFCFCCWLFPCKSYQGYENNWSEVGLAKVVNHENSKLHCISFARWKSFQTRLYTGKIIDAQLQQQRRKKEREKTLQVLDRIFSATLFLALQGISFRAWASVRKSRRSHDRIWK